MIAGSLRIWEFGFDEIIIARKVSKYGVFSGPYFPVFGLNTEIYGVILRIHSEHRKIRTRKNSLFGHFPPNVVVLVLLVLDIFNFVLNDSFLCLSL